MSNLIVAIFAIALAAVLTYAGAYYGGTSFMQSLARANAAKDINYLSQVAGAINLWSQRNGGTLPEPHASYPSACTNTAYCSISDIQTLVGARYLASTTVPSNTDAGMLLYWNEVTPLSMTSPVLLLRLGTTPFDQSACQSIETLRQGSSPSALRVFNGGTADVNRYLCGDSGCFQNDGTFGSTSTYLYIAYVRLRGIPVAGSTDYAGPTCPTS